MSYTVKIPKKIDKQLAKCPREVQELFRLLVADIKKSGPIQKKWRNFSDLGKNKYHCHLNYHWVACWYYEKKSIVVEVTYVGSREKAPY